MNSIQKEREAFEKTFAQTEFYRNKADLYSLLADIDDEPLDFFRKNGFGEYSIGEAQAAWSAWQAAKAQAVPDGFMAVPIDKLARAAQNIRELNNGEYYSEEIEENVCTIEAMIEAQESK